MGIDLFQPIYRTILDNIAKSGDIGAEKHRPAKLSSLGLVLLASSKEISADSSLAQDLSLSTFRNS